MSRIAKIASAQAPSSPEGEVRLGAGRQLRLQLWCDEQPTDGKPMRHHDYEVVGYARPGCAELEIEVETVDLVAGDSLLVTAGALHTYLICETCSAVEFVTAAIR